MNFDDLATLTYKLGTQRCWGLLAANGYPRDSVGAPRVELSFASNGCTHCTVTGYVGEALIGVSTKLDAMPDPGMTGPQLNTVLSDEPNIFIIVEQIRREDGKWTTLYENPCYE